MPKPTKPKREPSVWVVRNRHERVWVGLTLDEAKELVWKFGDHLKIDEYRRVSRPKRRSKP